MLSFSFSMPFGFEVVFIVINHNLKCCAALNDCRFPSPLFFPQQKWFVSVYLFRSLNPNCSRYIFTSFLWLSAHHYPLSNYIDSSKWLANYIWMIISVLEINLKKNIYINYNSILPYVLILSRPSNCCCYSGEIYKSCRKRNHFSFLILLLFLSKTSHARDTQTHTNKMSIPF